MSTHRGGVSIPGTERIIMLPSAKKLLVLTAIVLGLSLFFSIPPVPAAPEAPEKVIDVTAKKFEFSPKTITLKKGVPVVIHLTSLDRLHGFNCPKLGIRADVKPNETTELRFVPTKTGVFPFYCDIWCGSGHEDMSGKILVEP